jgi:hypothetical protein
MKIEADYIQIDWDKGMIFARGKLDSTRKIKEPATATQGGKKYEYNDLITTIKPNRLLHTMPEQKKVKG